MHKKLASELTALAHSILQMKDKDDVFALQKKAHDVYEKISVLAYIETYINTTPQATETKEELIAKLEKKQEKECDIVLEEENHQANVSLEKVEQDDALNTEKRIEEEPIEQPFEEIENIIFGDTDNEKLDEPTFIEASKTQTLEDELKDTISVDVTADLFTKIESKKSLNDKLQNTIQIGLNDRIAFVNHLFNGNSEDYNRVVSQLNTFDSEKEAKNFINKNVKPDYDWTTKEEYENRFFEIIERKFA